MSDPKPFDATASLPPVPAEPPTLTANLSESVVQPTACPVTAASDLPDEGATEADPHATYSPAPRAERIGSVIAGRYTLQAVIGEGGMGSVYRAQQTEPVKRDVALKLIKVGMDSRSVLARFNAERQALALMDHPNIARVYDGGTTSSGQPFFVMELVHGVPITEYCDAHRLTPQARLELFVAVCQAVQHAHQKGIIHRDLKPSNILVTEVDGRPTPKVIDFGVAKATEQRLLEQSFNDTGAIVGTPTYMSPEQADPTSMDIDTRTDVYALGVVMYELLTGSPPIDAKQFKRGAVLEMLRMVREVEPPRPSTKLSTAEGLPNIAAARNMEPGKLARLMQGELDWVVMKALEKDRTRRYESANGLARDIQRYLADEVVEARPPSRGYRMKKFIRRNKVQVTAAALVFFALVGGMIGTTMGLIQARNARAAEAIERQRAEDNAKTAAINEQLAIEERNRAVKLQGEAEAARETTATQRQLALTTVRDVLLRVDELMKNDAKLAPLRIEIIRRMIDNVDRIRDHAKKNPLEDRTEATALSRIGDVYAKTNRSQEAIAPLRKSEAILQSLVDQSPNDRMAIRNLSFVKTALAEAEWQVGQGPAARRLHTEALRLRQLCKGLIPANAEEIEMASAQMDIADSLMHLAYAELRLGLPDDAIANYQAADAALAALPPPLGHTIRTKRLRSEILVRIADARCRLNQPEAGEKLFLQALADREELLKLDPRPKAVKELILTDVGQSLMYLGDFHMFIQRDKVKAKEYYDRCFELFAKQLKDDPDNLDLRQRMGASHYRLGIVEPNPAKAQEQFVESLKYREALSKIDPSDMPAAVEYLLSLARLDRFDDVNRLIDRILRQAGTDPQSLFQTACGLAICGRGNDEAAKKYRDRAFEVLDRLVKAGWRDPTGIHADPDFEFIRNDPRFAAFIKRKGP